MKLEIKLLEEAKFSNSANGNWMDKAYSAKATIGNLPCTIWWTIENEEAENEDESCNWEKPYLIIMDSQNIDPDEYEIEIINR